MHLRTGVNMVPHPGFAPLESFTSAGRSYRWFEEALSLDLYEMDAVTSHKVSVNWDKLCGMATLLVVCGGGWTAAGIAATHLFR
jgi:hypothetical protein